MTGTHLICLNCLMADKLIYSRQQNQSMADDKIRRYLLFIDFLLLIVICLNAMEY